MGDSELDGDARRSAAAWMAMARQDLAVAELIAASDLGVRWAACFHAQQASEKALKGLLAARGIDFPKTHFLERLADLLEDDDARALNRSGLARLTPWAVAGRYPEDIPEPTMDDAREVIAEAVKVLAAVSARLLN